MKFEGLKYPPLKISELQARAHARCWIWVYLCSKWAIRPFPRYSAFRQITDLSDKLFSHIEQRKQTDCGSATDREMH